MDRIVIFSKKLKNKLSETNTKQNSLAQQLGFTPQVISDYLKYGKSNGKEGKKPALETVIKIAEIFDCSLDDLFGFSDRQEKNNINVASSCDAINAINAILNFDKYAVLKTSKTDDDVWGEIYVARIETTHPYISEFLFKQCTMKDLISNGTIPKEIYDAWFVGEMEKLRSFEADPFGLLREEVELNGIDEA